MKLLHTTVQYIVGLSTTLAFNHFLHFSDDVQIQEPPPERPLPPHDQQDEDHRAGDERTPQAHRQDRPQQHLSPHECGERSEIPRRG